MTARHADSDTRNKNIFMEGNIKAVNQQMWKHTQRILTIDLPKGLQYTSAFSSPLSTSIQRALPLAVPAINTIMLKLRLCHTCHTSAL